jgi:hypothetical protein
VFDAVQALAIDAEHRAAIQFRRHMYSVNARVEAWAVRCVTGHAAEGHGYLRGPVVQTADIMTDMHGVVLDTPESIAVGKRDYWSQFWRSPLLYEINCAGQS